MRARARAHDWAATPLGPVAGWPPALRTAAALALAYLTAASTPGLGSTFTLTLPGHQ
jgi:hypothetical protein